MATTTGVQLITGEELAAMGEVGPCELVEGRIVPVTPSGAEHAEIESTLAAHLVLFVKQHKLGRVFSGEVGIYTRRNPDTVRGADVAYVAHERLGPENVQGYLTVAPDLVVEVVSPHDTWTEITTKLDEYFTAGVRAIWIVEPKRRTVYVYTSPNNSHSYGPDDTLTAGDVLPGFALPISDLFR